MAELMKGKVAAITGAASGIGLECARTLAAEGATVDVESVRGWLTERLAKYKVPKHYHEVDALPRNAGGKVTKDVLRRNDPR